MRGCRSCVATRCAVRNARPRVQAIGAHGDLKELFGVLADELHRVVQFDFIGVSLRAENLPTFKNYFIDVTTRTELLPDEELTPEETLTPQVYERQESLLRSTNEMEPRYSRLQALLRKPIFAPSAHCH
jgi:hypothetical protein